MNKRKRPSWLRFPRRRRSEKPPDVILGVSSPVSVLDTFPFPPQGPSDQHNDATPSKERKSSSPSSTPFVRDEVTENEEAGSSLSLMPVGQDDDGAAQKTTSAASTKVFWKDSPAHKESTKKITIDCNPTVMESDASKNYVGRSSQDKVAKQLATSPRTNANTTTGLALSEEENHSEKENDVTQPVKIPRTQRMTAALQPSKEANHTVIENATQQLSKSPRTNGKTTTRTVLQPLNGVKQTTKPSLSINQRVTITSNDRNGEMGVIVGQVRKGTFKVRLDDSGEIVNKRSGSLRPEPATALRNNVDSASENALSTHVPPRAPRSDFPKAGFNIGQKVVILTKDRYKGKVGVIVDKVMKGLYKVKLEDGSTTDKRSKSLQPFIESSNTIAEESLDASMEGSAPPEERETSVKASYVTDASNAMGATGSESIALTERRASRRGGTHSISSNEASNETVRLCVGMSVQIVRGAHKNKTGRIIGLKGKKTLVVDIPGVGTIDKRAASVFTVDGDSTGASQLRSSSLAGGDWRVEDFDRGATRFGSRQIEKIRFRKNGTPPKEQCFLNHLLGDRFLLVEEALVGNECSESFATNFDQDGFNYELVSVKVRNDSEAEGGGYNTPKCVHLMYAKVSGHRLAPIDIQVELLKIADFASLNPRKVMARLELLQSPAYMFPNKQPAIFFLRAADFTLIEDLGYSGCGFIDVNFLVKLAMSKGMSETEARRLLAIQNRIFIPSLGIFKGMLCRKRISSGAPIQLCASMLKVGPSKSSVEDSRACLLVTKNGFHSNSKLNGYIGRMLDSEAKPPPKKSFQACMKPLSEMILRLFQGLNVPKEVCDDYAKKSRKPNHLNHAWTVGLADPTDLLPEGHVFVTGLGNLRTTMKEIFVTRSPCIHPSDGVVLPCVTSKPSAMTDDEWEWLNNSFPFGGIIFSNPPKGMLPMPERIADGDLDGDLYFVCWNSQILTHIKSSPLKDQPADEDSGPVGQSNSTWFSDAQELMIDSATTQDIGALTGKLYTLSNKIANESPLFNSDPDAIAFGDAFKRALEFGKHGGAIALPSHLHDRLPQRLRQYVVDVNESDKKCE